MNDQRVGGVVRALRRRRRWRQIDLAGAARTSQSTISEIERGHFDAIPLRTLRAVFAGLDARAELDPWWRGGALDRLLDERHARLVEMFVRALASEGWQPHPEVTYARDREVG